MHTQTIYNNIYLYIHTYATAIGKEAYPESIILYGPITADIDVPIINS